MCVYVYFIHSFVSMHTHVCESFIHCCLYRFTNICFISMRTSVCTSACVYVCFYVSCTDARMSPKSPAFHSVSQTKPASIIGVSEAPEIDSGRLYMCRSLGAEENFLEPDWGGGDVGTGSQMRWLTPGCPWNAANVRARASSLHEECRKLACARGAQRHQERHVQDPPAHCGAQRTWGHFRSPPVLLHPGHAVPGRLVWE